MALSSLDASLFKALNSGLNIPLIDPMMVFITEHNQFIFLALFLLFFKQEGKRALVVLLLAIAAFGIMDWTGGQLKDVFARPRPCQSLSEIILLVKCTGLSMPSNHAANSFAFALPFVMLSKERLRWLFLAFAALVAYSRIYVGVHYPGDIAVGALLGTAIGIGASYIYRHFKDDKEFESTGASENEGSSNAP